STSSLAVTLALLFFLCSGAHRALHSFPTRRSSDLDKQGELQPKLVELQAFPSLYAYQLVLSETYIEAFGLDRGLKCLLSGLDKRSEEHTSELQSRGHLVCRLLLEKKKQNNTTNTMK